MPVSTHYYVLSFGLKTNMLFEAFRDCLIDIEDQGFPIASKAGMSSADSHDQQRELARTADTHLAHYYLHDSLGLVVVGEESMQSAFSDVTTHGAAIIGRVAGDHTDTSVRDLGRIVWAVVKQVMSGVLERAIRDLAASAEQGQAASGLTAVARLVNEGVGGTLLVEDNYHVRGSLAGPNQSPVISPDVDVRDSLDDAVDVVIEKVIELGGNVVFTPNGSLNGRNRIALLLRSKASK